MAEYTTIHVVHDTSIATIVLNRPEKRNALTIPMLQELAAAFAAIEGDPQVRAVVLAGAGKGFCAGQDLAIFEGSTTADDVRDAILKYYRPLITKMCELDKPIVGAINGVAAGAGASLALACDLRVMAEDASILQAFSNIGLVPDAGSTWFLARHLGYSRAFEIAVEGEKISAHRCLELGLTNRIVPAETLLESARAWAYSLAQRPTLAIGLTKRALMQAFTNTLEQSIALEAQLQREAIVSNDHREGVRAFSEKRTPRFSGQ
ncbi:MAG: enoyl-CoA hydratase [Caldilineaceae bacterium]|nr:enoyl-CoA hydratase [Caldilineaceae bacterium]